MGVGIVLNHLDELSKEELKILAKSVKDKLKEKENVEFSSTNLVLTGLRDKIKSTEEYKKLVDFSTLISNTFGCDFNVEMSIHEYDVMLKVVIKDDNKVIYTKSTFFNPDVDFEENVACLEKVLSGVRLHVLKYRLDLAYECGLIKPLETIIIRPSYNQVIVDLGVAVVSLLPLEDSSTVSMTVDVVNKSLAPEYLVWDSRVDDPKLPKLDGVTDLRCSSHETITSKKEYGYSFVTGVDNIVKVIQEVVRLQKDGKLFI